MVWKKTQYAQTHLADDRKTRAKELRVRARKKSADISGRQSTIVRSELQVTEKIEKLAQTKKQIGANEKNGANAMQIGA